MAYGTYGNQQLFTDAVTDISSTAVYNLGTRRVEAAVEYVYAKNNKTTAATGLGMIAEDALFNLTKTSAAGNPCFGVVVTEFTAAYYGWVAVRGSVIVKAGANGVTTKTPIVLGTDGVFETVVTALAGGTAVVAGYSVGALASAGTGTAYLNCIG